MNMAGREHGRNRSALDEAAGCSHRAIGLPARHGDHSGMLERQITYPRDRLAMGSIAGLS